jgi:hypothetical protein
MIVVFQERGTLFNKHVLRPGEAASMTRKQTGGSFLLPYKVHAVIGDERALPTGKDSVKNLVKVTAIPAAFVTGCLVTAVGAGMLVGPSAALAPLVSGMVLNGVVIDTTAIAAGGLLATRAQAVTDMLLRDQPDKFMCKTRRLKPGTRYLVVKGGLSDGPVVIEDTPKRDFSKLTIKVWKEPNENSNQEKIEYIADDSGNGEEAEIEVNMIEAN